MVKAIFTVLTLVLMNSPSLAQEGLIDVKGPVAYPVSYWLLLIIAGLILLVGLTIFLFKRYFNRDVTPEAEFVEEDTRTAWEKAFDSLKPLNSKPLRSQEEFDSFFTQLSLIIRRYLEDRFELKAPDMTTEEFLASLRGSQCLSENQKDALKEFMELSDMVKFAKFLPSVDNAQEGYRLACNLVETTIPKEEESTAS